MFAMPYFLHVPHLQNPENKREIFCDGKLKKIMGKDKVSMFEMNKLLSSHLLEKLDKSAYQHVDEGSESEQSDE